MQARKSSSICITLLQETKHKFDLIEVAHLFAIPSAVAFFMEYGLSVVFVKNAIFSLQLRN